MYIPVGLMLCSLTAVLPNGEIIKANQSIKAVWAGLRTGMTLSCAIARNIGAFLKNSIIKMVTSTTGIAAAIQVVVNQLTKIATLELSNKLITSVANTIAASLSKMMVRNSLLTD